MKMQISLENKVAVITGGGGGIGRAIAGKLACENMTIVLIGGNNLAKLTETRQIVEQFSSCHLFPGDLSDLDFVSRAVAEAGELCGGIDVLINNAGVAQSTRFEEISVEEYDRIMTINTKVPFFLTQYALPFLKRSTTPAVINIASVVAHAG